MLEMGKQAHKPMQTRYVRVGGHYSILIALYTVSKTMALWPLKLGVSLLGWQFGLRQQVKFARPKAISI